MLSGLRLILYFLMPYAHNKTGAEHVNKASAVHQVALCKKYTFFKSERLL